MSTRLLNAVAILGLALVSALAFHAWLASRDEQQRLKTTLAAQKQLLDAADAREHAREGTLRDTLAQIEKLKRTTQTPAQIVRALPQYLPLPQPITLVPAPASSTAGQKPGQGIGAYANSLSSPGGSSSRSRVGAAHSASKVPATDGNVAMAADAFEGQGFSSEVGARPGHVASPPKDVAKAAGPQPPVPSDDGSTKSSASTDDLPTGPTAQIPAADLKPLFDYAQDCRACQAQLAVARQNATDDAVKIAALARERDAAITAAKGGSLWRRLRRNALWFAVGAGLGAAAAHAASN